MFVLISVLAMLSPAQAIIAAEAGVIAKAENMAVVIKIFFHRFWLRPRFFNQDTFVCCDAVEKTPSGRFFAQTTVNEPGTRRRRMS